MVVVCGFDGKVDELLRFVGLKNVKMIREAVIRIPFEDVVTVEAVYLADVPPEERLTEGTFELHRVERDPATNARGTLHRQDGCRNCAHCTNKREPASFVAGTCGLLTTVDDIYTVMCDEICDEWKAKEE